MPKKQMLFKLKEGVGNHASGDVGDDGRPIIYKPEDGHIFKSDVDLTEAFKGKCERVHGVSPDDVDDPKPAKPKGKKAEPKDEDPGDEPNPLGRNVTEKFPEAIPQGLMVFADGGAFSVVEAGEPTVPLHKNPLHKKQVKEFIKKHLEG